jgi:probable HAF family extracellular repeat protein
MGPVRSGILAAAVASVLTVMARAEPVLTSIDPLPGQTQTIALAVNAAGSVVAVTSVGGVPPFTAMNGCRWSQATGIVQLAAGQPNGVAVVYALSDDATVFVGDNGQDPIRWTAALGAINLGGFGGPVGGQARGVSADGSVVIGMVSTPSDWRAFRWTEATGMQSLGLPIDSNATYGYGVSDDGAVVVGIAQVSTGVRAFRWTAAAGIQTLPVPAGFAGATAYGVSGDGLVVVGQSDGGPPNVSHAIRWEADGTVTDLGGPAGANSTGANCANHDGSVIGGSSNVGAFIWTSWGGMLNLASHLASLGVDMTGWQLNEMYGMSADASVLVGTGVFRGQARGWVASGLSFAPPPPCADVSGDGQVNFVDVTSVLANWNTTSPFGDANEDGAVNFADITAILANWGATCP